MSPLAARPWWYCSPGTPRPDHCPHLGGVALARPVGPDGQAGTCYGGAYDPATASQWIATDPGVWIWATGRGPQGAIRDERHPRVPRWRDVAGAQPGHLWSVPVLLTARTGGLGLQSALDRIWAGDAGWLDQDLRPLQERLRALLAQAEQSWHLIADDAARLAVDLLRVGHHLTAREIARLGWLSEAAAADILYAACDTTAAEVQALLTEAGL